MINKQDLIELQRLATNFYDDDKKFVHRVIHQATLMDRELQRLTAEVASLKKDLATAKAAAEVK